MDFTLPPEIDDIRLRTRAFVEEQVLPLEADRGNYDDHEERRNSFESWTLQFGVDKQIGDKWRMQTRVQRGATRKYTAVLNELRVDKEYLGMDAVEVYPDRRDLNGDGIPDLVADADRGKGTILCNVNRYNPTTAALAASGWFARS